MTDTVQRGKDRLILIVLGLHTLVVLVFSLLTDHLHAFWPGLIAMILALIVYSVKPGSLLSRSTIAFSLMIFSGVLIHLSGGLIEMHFHVFTALALLSIYYDWRVIIVAGITISLHHLVGLISPAFDVYAPNPNLAIFLLHVLFVAITCLIISYQCYTISRSVSTINQNSKILVEHDLPQLMEYLHQISAGNLNGGIEFRAKTVPVVASDELGHLSRLHNQLVLSCESVSKTAYLLGQALMAMVQRSQENIEHIRKIAIRLARSVEQPNNYLTQEFNLGHSDTDQDYRIKELIELVSARMVMAALQLDELQYKLEDKIAEQNRLNQQLEEMNRVKTRFFASLSHELRTPLTAILAYSELLALELETHDHPALESAHQIAESAMTMRQLINDILDFSKLEAGKLKVSLDKTDLSHSFARAVEEVGLLAENKGLKVIQQFETLEEPPVVVADTMRLHQILLNLLSNAIKFTPPGGRIELRSVALYNIGEAWLYRDGTCWDQHYCYPPLKLPHGNWIGIQVRDTGLGIDREQLALIFEEFEQVEEGLQRGVTGTGLGLAIVKKLTGLMNGQVVVESERGQGTVFTVLLPAWTHTGLELEKAATSNQDNLVECV
jgi:signal transduction histidine kinase